MSRVGRSPVAVTSGVSVSVSGSTVTAKGPLGELALELPESIGVTVGASAVEVSCSADTRRARSMHGLSRNLIANLIQGVSKGYKKTLLIEGVGFKAALQGNKLSLSLGFASPVVFLVPAGIKITEEGGTKLGVSGADKQLVGDTAARIRSYFPAEPYKGKGIRYEGEHVKRKVGKTVA